MLYELNGGRSAECAHVVSHPDNVAENESPPGQAPRRYLPINSLRVTNHRRRRVPLFSLPFCEPTDHQSSILPPLQGQEAKPELVPPFPVRWLPAIPPVPHGRCRYSLQYLPVEARYHKGRRS